MNFINRIIYWIVGPALDSVGEQEWRQHDEGAE